MRFDVAPEERLQLPFEQHDIPLLQDGPGEGASSTFLPRSMATTDRLYVSRKWLSDRALPTSTDPAGIRARKSRSLRR